MPGRVDAVVVGNQQSHSMSFRWREGAFTHAPPAILSYLSRVSKISGLSHAASAILPLEVMCVRDKGWTALQAPNQDHGLLRLAAMVTMIIKPQEGPYFPRAEDSAGDRADRLSAVLLGHRGGAEKTRTSAAMP